MAWTVYDPYMYGAGAIAGPTALVAFWLVIRLTTARPAVALPTDTKEHAIDEFEQHWSDAHGTRVDEASYEQQRRRTHVVLTLLAFAGIALDALHYFSAVQANQTSVLRLVGASATLKVLVVVIVAVTGIPQQARMLAVVLLQLVYLVTHLLTFLYDYKQHRLSTNTNAAWAVDTISVLVSFLVAVTSRTGPPVQLGTIGKLGPRRVQRTMLGGGSVCDFLFGFLAFPVVKAALLHRQVDQDTVPGLDAHFRSALIAERIIDIYRTALARSQQRYPAGQRSDSRKALTLLKTMLSANSSLLLQQLAIIVVTTFSFYAPKLGLSFVLEAIESYAVQLDQDGAKDTVSGRARATLLYSAAFYLVVFWEAFIVFACFTNVFVSFKCLFQVQLTSLLAWKRLRQKESSGSAPQHEDAAETRTAAPTATATSPSSSSQVLNLVTTDIYRISNKTEMLAFGIMGPLEIFVGGYSAYLLLGRGALLGLGTAALMQPVAIYMGSVTKKIDETLQGSRDRRVMLLSETIKAMRMVKYQAWEDEIADKIMQARNAELRCQAKSWVIYTFFAGFFALTPVLVIVVSFGYYTLVDGHTLTAAVAFPAVAVLMELRWAVSYLPNIFLTYIQAWVSLKRIAVYLETEDIDLPSQPPRSNNVCITDAQLTWPTDVNPNAQESLPTSARLDDLNSAPVPRFVLAVQGKVQFETGKLNLVCGKIGSGKTLLLLSLLGETDLLSGTVSCPRSHPSSTLLACKRASHNDIDFTLTAYAPQRPFLFNASIRENILFGLEYDKRRYADVILACGLRPDLRMLQDADRTEIGEGGTNLSGGQKARVSLARAVYSRAGTILIDDCLSALDSHTTKHVCEHLFDDVARTDAGKTRRRQSLLHGRTVVLVTHHVRLMAPRASKVLMLVDGKVGFIGTSNAFVQSKHFDHLEKEQQDEQLAEDAEPGSTDTSADEDDLLDAAHLSSSAKSAAPELTAAATSGFSQRSAPRRRASSSAFSRATDVSNDGDDADDVHRLVSEEKRAVGRVSYAVYNGYIKAGGGYLLWSLILLGFCSNAFSDLLANWWLRMWSSASTARRDERHSTEWWLYRWMAIQALQVASITIGTALVCVASLLAGSRLFHRLLRTVLRAPLRFHDSVPAGRLLNRFGKDMEGIDSTLGQEFVDAAKGLLLALAALVATWLGGGFAVLIILLVMAPIFYTITVTFTIAARDLKRLDSTTSSHRISAFTDLITGVVTIRAFGASSAYMSTLIERMDENLVFYFWQGMVRQWQTLLFSMASSGFVISTLMVVTLTPGFTAARAGFTLSFVQSLISTMQYGMRSATNVEQALVSVERVLEYLDIETEPLDSAEVVPPTWPQTGRIEIKDLCLRYAPMLPDVLKGVTLTIRPGEKVGIVGSTGSGKSTLVSALFRFFEYHSGSISIDGVDIARVGLKDLRSRMQIVPQDPLILSGTLRSAVDPLGHFSDDEISSVLHTVGLLARTQPPAATESYGTFDTVGDNDDSGTLSSLEAPIQESGANLSAGQKQLVSLSRILLSSAASDSPYASSSASKIIVLDESTSSIDYQTDLKIQTLLAAHFQRHATTVLAIAHRLRSIIDYDTVIVLDHGRIVEQGHPKHLLQQEGGHFQTLAKDTGAQEYEALRRLVSL